MLDYFFQRGGGPSALDLFTGARQAQSQYDQGQQLMQARDQEMQARDQEMQVREQEMAQAEAMNPLLLDAQRAGNYLTGAQTQSAIDANARQEGLQQGRLDQQGATLAQTEAGTQSTIDANTRAQQMQPLAMSAQEAQLAAAQEQRRLASQQRQQGATEFSQNQSYAAAQKEAESFMKLGSIAQSVKDFGPEGSQERADFVKRIIPNVKKLGIDLDFEKIAQDGVSDAEIDEVVGIANSLSQRQASGDLSLDVQEIMLDDGTKALMQTSKTGEGQIVRDPTTGEIARPAPSASEQKMAASKLEKQEKYEKARLSTIDKSANVLNAIDSAMKKSGFLTTGIAGKIAGVAGSENRKSMIGDLQTIGANLAFSELQEMRQNSPTGGALGGIALGELELLKSTIASLDPDMGEKDLDKNLKYIQGKMRKIKGMADGSITLVRSKEDVASLPPGSVFIDSESGAMGRKK